MGANSLRIRARLMGEILDTDDALRAPDKGNGEVEVYGDTAVDRNGKLHAVLRGDEHP